jgi:hypothetical protein
VIEPLPADTTSNRPVEVPDAEILVVIVPAGDSVALVFVDLAGTDAIGSASAAGAGPRPVGRATSW